MTNELMENQKWYTIQDLAELCGFASGNALLANPHTNELLNQFNNSQNIKLGGYHNTQKFYSENVLKALKQYQIKNSVPNALKEKETAKTMTVKEVAVALGTADSTIRNKVAELFPECIKNGVATRLTEQQVTMLKENLVPRNLTLKSKVESSVTRLEMMQNIQRDMQWLISFNEELRKENEQQKQQLAEQKPKVDVYNRIADGRGCFTVNQAAKALKLPYGNKTLFKKLKELGILNQDNSPNQTQTNSGNFKVVVKFINDDVGNKNVTLITSKGLVYLAKKFNTTIDESVKADA